MTRRILFFIVVILQIVFLLGMIVIKERELNTGFPVRLSVLPIDPNDLMRGEYVRLEYDISRLDLSKVPHDLGEYSSGSVIYVSLSRNSQLDSQLWFPKKVYRTLPASSDFPFIKGQIQWVNHWSNSSTKMYQLNVDYSIGQYFVQQGRAKEIESAIGPWNQTTTRRVSVEVRLANDGRPAISKLFIDDKEFK